MDAVNGFSAADSFVWDDPATAANALAAEQAQQQMDIHQEERRAASEDRQRELKEQAAATSAGANARLAAGLAQGTSSVLQGVSSLVRAEIRVRQTELTAQADRCQDSADRAHNDNTDDNARKGQIESTRLAGLLGAQDGRVEGGARMIDGVTTAATAILDRIAAAYDAEVRSREQCAERARDRCEAAGDALHNAESLYRQSVERQGQDIDAQAQTVFRVYGNIQG